tara:strand:+ start:549 stop:824 length:276 start_codon:yes stop_codon:yes gene_type:complete
MGILITTSSLQEANACTSSFAYVTGSLWVEGNPWYSGSNYEAYFEENVVYPYSCSNMNEMMALMWACDVFSITASLHNNKTNFTTYYHKTR